MPPACAPSSLTPWRRPIAAPRNSPPSSERRKSMEAIRYIVDMLLWLLMLAFMLRLLFQWVRADFRDPMADAIVRVTNWLVLPLRRVLPPIGKIDTATVLAVLLVASAHTEAMLLLAGIRFADPLLFARITAIDLIGMVLRVYLFAFLLYWL